MVVAESLKKGLQVIGFHADGSEKSSVIFVSDLKNSSDKLLPVHALELENASYFKADAVFFRYFDDGRPPVAQVYFYDNSSNDGGLEYARIHKELWSSCHIPAFIVVERTRLKIFDCRKPVSVSPTGEVFTKETALIDLENLSNYADIIEKYSAEKFRNGSFWESPEAHDNYLYGRTAYTNLIEKLKDLRKNYNENLKISQRLFDYVIIISTLIKFLEENGIDASGDNLAAKFFQENVQCDTFIEILQQNKLVAILEKLAIKFNGGIFDLSESDKAELQKAKLLPVVKFFDSKIEKNNQYRFWDLYSFKHIPVELISNIYEEFLPVEDKGAVYTPHYLVNLLIDECLPLPGRNEVSNTSVLNKKIIDVSCGSGIFLVNSFKRLVQYHKINQFYSEGTAAPKMGIRALQKILKENIFGVDLNKNAVELTKFSLQLALCQMLSPKQIWTELTFQNLGLENILEKDFFEFICIKKYHGQFDLIIGNPPFNPPPDEEGKRVKNSDYFKKVVKKYNLKVYPTKDSNLALLFLQLSTQLLDEQAGLLCLIQPAIPLLHKKGNEGFREMLFNQYNVPQVIDFTTLRRVLFPTATVPTCAVFIQNRKKRHEFITHIVIRRTNPSKERLFFEIDSYDVHSIEIKDAPNNYSWKCNLFGGYRLFNLVERLKKSADVTPLALHLKDHVSGNYSDLKDKISKTSGVYFEMKLTDGLFPKYVASGKTKSNAGTIGLIADKAELGFLKQYLDSNAALMMAYMVGTSTRQGLDRPYDLVVSDILSLPLLNNKTKLSIGEKILVSDIADYKITEFGQGENAPTNKEIEVQGDKLPEELKAFCTVYSNALNSVYFKKDKKILLTNVDSTPWCFVMGFEYGIKDQRVIKIAEHKNFDLQALVTNGHNSSVVFKRIAIVYCHSKIYIIKPKQLRYWLKSTALADADSTMSDIVNLNLLHNNDLQ